MIETKVGAVTVRSIVSSFMVMAISIVLVAASHAEPAEPALRGKRIFLRCASCHELAPSGIHRIGPSLQGVYGRKAGSLPGFAYSPALQATDFSWTAENLDRWLERPSALVPGTAMAFAGLPKAEDRQAVIAYLQNPGG
jgi:cytochrome c